MAGAVIGSSIINIATGGDIMSGAVMGSAIQDISKSPKKWGAIMINTGCNLDCSRCYLGKKNGNTTMSKETARIIADYAVSNWEGIVIIGTEPLLDEQSVEIIGIFSSQIKTHLLTNGVNLSKFANKIKNIQRIDISLDGGPETYCRSDKFKGILAGAKEWKTLSNGEVYLLHMLSRENCKSENIYDMLMAGELFESVQTVFSPYIETIGGNPISTISTREISQILKEFSGPNWVLIIDSYHALFERREWQKIKEDVSCLSKENIFLVDFDPGDRIDRVDISGNTHHPFIALHPGINLPGKPLIQKW